MKWGNSKGNSLTGQDNSQKKFHILKKDVLYYFQIGFSDLSKETHEVHRALPDHHRLGVEMIAR
jgi:hypothetical protein